MRNPKAHFTKALAADPDRIHVAAHSHHLWPDVSETAQARAWNDAMRLADRKWDFIFEELWPKAQSHVARLLRLPDPRSVTFSPSTHDFLVRILSCVSSDERPPRVLTTDSEFHSAHRQFERLEEEGLLDVVRVPQEPFASFEERWQAEASKGPFDLVFLSHVSYRSGFVTNLSAALAPFMGDAPSEGPLVVVDGYHGFCAVDTDFAPFAKRAFYVAGGYKYAMSGEGCCFLHAPPGYGTRPRITGWFASFGSLASAATGTVPYGKDASRFLGATFDPTAIYRFVAVMDLLEREQMSISALSAHARSLSATFVAGLEERALPLRKSQLLLPVESPVRGAFLTFEFEGEDEATKVHERLLAANIVTDVRGERLRLCFSAYHDDADVVRLLERLETV
ncbi:MAG: aminotransferase class V-fold PLP-dependent enzyme [Polyangiaceae bacterium]